MLGGRRAGGRCPASSAATGSCSAPPLVTIGGSADEPWPSQQHVVGAWGTNVRRRQQPLSSPPSAAQLQHLDAESPWGLAWPGLDLLPSPQELLQLLHMMMMARAIGLSKCTGRREPVRESSAGRYPQGGEVSPRMSPTGGKWGDWSGTQRGMHQPAL